MLLKSSVEPYIHLNLEQIVKIFGVIEAQKKVLFEDWWSMITSNDKGKSSQDLVKEFEQWFTTQTTTEPTTGGGQ